MQDSGDLRPLLLVPAGIWRPPGSRMSGANWLVVLVLFFAGTHALQWADTAVMQALEGLANGHALHYLALAGCIG